MDVVTSIAAIALAISIGAASPGPSFFVVARTSVASGRSGGLAAAIGMGCASALFAALALFGLHMVLLHFHWLYVALKIGGGFYLIWMAYGIWRGSKEPAATGAALEPGAHGHLLRRGFLRGFTTQLANPKTAVVYAAVFAALLPAHPPLWTGAVLIPVLFMIEAGWYSIVATVFSMSKPRTAYLGFKQWIDRGAATVIGALGASLIIDAISEN
ncbi:LysE family translocator [Hoeflea sp. TYP-13]|uniref:LysE family translocator n=1 Tax=Hoeflea sp. TYP-13 TaxID=3230023 RepID=UPI0034C67C72